MLCHHWISRYDINKNYIEIWLEPQRGMDWGGGFSAKRDPFFVNSPNNHIKRPQMPGNHICGYNTK